MELVSSGVDISSLLQKVEANASHISLIQTNDTPVGGATMATLATSEGAGPINDLRDVASDYLDESYVDLPGHVSKSLDRRYLNNHSTEPELRKTLLSRSVDMKVTAADALRNRLIFIIHRLFGGFLLMLALKTLSNV